MRVGKKTRAALQPRVLLTLHFYCLFISTNAELSVEIQSGRAAWHRERVWKIRRLNVAAPAVSLPEGNRQHVSVTTSELSNMVTTQLPSLTHPHSCWLFITPTKSWTTDILLSWRDEFFKLDTYDFSRGSQPVTFNKN